MGRHESVWFNIYSQVGGQAVLGRQLQTATPWLTERHGYDPTYSIDVHVSDVNWSVQMRPAATSTCQIWALPFEPATWDVTSPYGLTFIPELYPLQKLTR